MGYDQSNVSVSFGTLGETDPTFFVSSGAYVLKAKAVTKQIYEDSINAPKGSNSSSNNKQWTWKRQFLWIEGDALYVADSPGALTAHPIPLRLCRAAETIPSSLSEKLNIPTNIGLLNDKEGVQNARLSRSASMRNTTTASRASGGSATSGSGILDDTISPVSPRNCYVHSNTFIIRTADKVIALVAENDRERSLWVRGLNEAFPAQRILGPKRREGEDFHNNGGAVFMSQSPRGVPSNGGDNGINNKPSSQISSVVAISDLQNDSDSTRVGNNASSLAPNQASRAPYSSSTSSTSPHHPPPFNRASTGLRTDSKKMHGSPLMADHNSTIVITDANGQNLGHFVESDEGSDTEGQISAPATARKHRLLGDSFYFQRPSGAMTHFESPNSHLPAPVPVVETSQTSTATTNTNFAFGTPHQANNSNTSIPISAAELRKRSQVIAFDHTNTNSPGAAKATSLTTVAGSFYNNNSNNSTSYGSGTGGGVSSRQLMADAQSSARKALLSRSTKPTKFGYVGDSAEAKAAAEDSITVCRLGTYLLKAKSGKDGQGGSTLLDDVSAMERGDTRVSGIAAPAEDSDDGGAAEEHSIMTANTSFGNNNSMSQRGSIYIRRSSNGGGEPLSRSNSNAADISNNSLFGKNARIGGGKSTWKKRFVWLDGRELCYGADRSKREKSLFIDEIKYAYRFTYQEMKALQAPEDSRRHGWCVRLRNGRILNFAGESDAVVNAWVMALNYLRPETPEEVHAREQLELEEFLIEDERQRKWKERIEHLKAVEEERKRRLAEERKAKEEAQRMQETVKLMMAAKMMMDEQIRLEKEQKERERLAKIQEEEEAKKGGSSTHNTTLTVTTKLDDESEQKRRERELALEHEREMARYMEECHKPLSPLKTDKNRKGERLLADEKQRQGCCSVQ